MVQWVEDIPDLWLSECSVMRFPWHAIQVGYNQDVREHSFHKVPEDGCNLKHRPNVILIKCNFHEPPFQKKTKSSHPRTKKSVGMGGGLRGDCAETSESQRRPSSEFLFTKSTRILIREEETEVQLYKLLSVSFQRALTSGTVGTFLVEQGLGMRPKAQLSLEWE